MTDGQESSVETRVEELLAAMSLAEKAGQLTQYFYIGAPEAAVGDVPQPAGEVDQALAGGGVGSLLFQTDPAAINRLQRKAVEGSAHNIPARRSCSGRLTWPETASWPSSWSGSGSR